jgi:tRNA-specific 2-thiouridylase
MNMTKNRVLAAMSGGVDSSVTAALLVREGYEVIGVTYKSYTPPDADPFAPHRFGGCCTIGEVEDARRVAMKLDIPHYVLNMSEDFEQTVIADFIREYARGRTPNPCVRCNQFIKFAALRQKAEELGCDYVATGHYARRVFDETTGRYRLFCGVDESKDQSYVLYVLTQQQLAHSLFPLGAWRKEETRKFAEEIGLVVAHKPDSQEICFIEDNDYARFIREREPALAQTGDILDGEGCVIGKHEGVIHFTIGQRRGLAIAAGAPLYVTRIEAERNLIQVGKREELLSSVCHASPVHWIAGEPPATPREVTCKIRYQAPRVPATLTHATNDGLSLTLAEPQSAVTPGQSVVVYDGDEVLGGGTIIEK